MHETRQDRCARLGRADARGKAGHLRAARQIRCARKVRADACPLSPTKNLTPWSRLLLEKLIMSQLVKILCLLCYSEVNSYSQEPATRPNPEPAHASMKSSVAFLNNLIVCHPLMRSHEMEFLSSIITVESNVYDTMLIISDVLEEHWP
jgi:hypothetical protein